MFFHEKVKLIQDQYGEYIDHMDCSNSYSVKVHLKDNVSEDVQDAICKIARPFIVDFKSEKVLTSN